jgi:hypothetical protein
MISKIIISLIITPSIFLGVTISALAQNVTRQVQARDQLQGILFEAQGCKRQEKNVICVVWVTALTNDISNFTIYMNAGTLSSRLVDSEGSAYIPVLMQAGRDKTGYKGLADDYFQTRLTQGVPIKVISTFSDIPRSVKDIASLEISISDPRIIGKLKNLKIGEGNSQRLEAPRKLILRKK